MNHRIVIPSASLLCVQPRKRTDPTAPQRKRRERERIAEGLRYAPMTLPESRLARAVINEGLLTETEALDWRLVVEAAQALVIAWVDARLGPSRVPFSRAASERSSRDGTVVVTPPDRNFASR